MLQTKEFADLCKTTKRTIIHYDQLGLLKPVKRIKSNRYYSQKQILKFEKISLLQSLGFSLGEIKEKLSSRQTLTQIFLQNKQKIEQKQKEINTQMKKINEILLNLKKYKNILAPTIKNVSPYDFYGIEKEGRYVDIPSYCEELKKKIHDRKNLFSYFVIFKDDYILNYSPVKSHMIIGATSVKKTTLEGKKDILLYHVPRHIVITSVYTGSHASLGYIWEFLWEHIKKHKIVTNQNIHPREKYLRGPMDEQYEENYVTELQIPILNSPVIQYTHE